MRLYFEAPDGRRLAIDTDTKQYCTNYEGDTIPDNHRYIWIMGQQDLTIIERELDFNGWGYNAEFVNDSPTTAAEAAADPLHRPPRAAATPADRHIIDMIETGLDIGSIY